MRVTDTTPPAMNGTNGDLVNGHPSSWQAKHEVPPHFIGGNKLDAAPTSAVKDFVQKCDGHSVITSVSVKQHAGAVLWLIDLCTRY